MNEIMWTWGKLSALQFEKDRLLLLVHGTSFFSCVPHDMGIHDDDNDAFTKTENYNNNNNNNNKR